MALFNSASFQTTAVLFHSIWLWSKCFCPLASGPRAICPRSCICHPSCLHDFYPGFTPTTCHVSFMRLSEERFVGREKRTNQPHLPNFVHVAADHCSSRLPFRNLFRFPILLRHHYTPHHMPTIQTKNIITTTYYQHAQRFVVEYTSKGAAPWLPLILSDKRRLRTAVRHGEPILFCAKGAFPACRRQQMVMVLITIVC